MKQELYMHLLKKKKKYTEDAILTYLMQTNEVTDE